MRILHVFRTPVGGLFRHVRDLARGQQERGHAVGILCDSKTGGEGAARLLASADAYCDLGIRRIPISRLPGFGDLSGIRQSIAHAREVMPDVIHCHGAKGGLYGRIAAWHLGVMHFYTPHGGSLHYRWGTPAGYLFLATEWALARLGGGLHFVCKFEREAFREKIGLNHNLHRVIYNGLWPEEFALATPRPDAADVVFIGELRRLKGLDVLIDALARCAKDHNITACIAGDGPDMAQFKAQAAKLAVDGLLTFAGRLPAAVAFERGRIFVLPSRAESFPYVVLEACAAGLPVVASAVGGVPEILAEDRLVPPGDAEALAARLRWALENPGLLARQAAEDHDFARQNFQADRMVDEVLRLYKDFYEA